MRWRTDNAMEGAAGALPNTDVTGLFWFFEPGNVELAVKVLDGRAINGNYWFFYGALSNVEYWITLTDRQTGAVRRYHNRPGTFCGGADTSALPLRQALVVGPEVGSPSAPELAAGGALSMPLSAVPLGLAGSAAPTATFELPAALAFDDLAPPHATSAATAPCVPGPGTLCLSNRFRVEARWRATPARAAGAGEAREVDRHLAVARRLPHPERILEPQRRVEGHDQRVAPRTPAVAGRAVAERRDDAERRRERGLADAARADDDHQRVAVGDQLHDPSPAVVR